MVLIKKFFCFTILLAALVLWGTDEVHAAREFDIDSEPIYSVGPDGSTTVTHNISLTNKLPDIYATQYSLSIGSTRVTSAWARDSVGFLTTNLTKTDNATTIEFLFKDKSVGLGQTMTFTIGYIDEDIAQKNGRIWEINIPRPEDINEFNSYYISLIVPSEFQNPVQMTPEPAISSTQKNVLVFEFDKNALAQRGVTAIFGERQVMEFDLRYSLQNPSPIGKTAKIALPPDTPYQKVVYESISPAPNFIEVDEDGNWLANFSLEGSQSIEIHALGFVILSLNPEFNSDPHSSALESYLSPTLPWQVEDPTIQDLAKKLKTAENIYNYVVESLTYNYDRVQAGNARLGGKGALQHPDQAICTEFTDLFISLARAAGIPARELNGFAYTQNSNLRPLSLKQDILHAWPEYYSTQKKQWIPVDPTWGNTTQGIDYFSRFDLNHFVFVIHGKSAQTPFPAGFYKISQTEGKDITVTPSQKDPSIREDVSVSVNLPDSVSTGLTTRGSITLKNDGNAAIPKLEILVRSDEFDILTPTQNSLPALLPYSTQEVPVHIKSRSLGSDAQGTLEIKVAGNIYEHAIKITPIYQEIPSFALALALGAGFAAASIRSGSLLFPFLKRKSTLRR